MESVRVSIAPSETALDVAENVAPGADAPTAESLAHDKRAVYVRTVVGIALGMARSIALGRYLLPPDVSAYRVSTVWAGYFGLVALGTSDTLHFLGPVLYRRGARTELGELRGVALTMSLLAALCAMVGVALFAVRLRLASPGTAVTLGAVAFLTTLVPYLNIELWVAGQFRRQARVELTGAVVGTIASLGGLVVGGLRGFLVGNMIGTAITFVMARDAFAFSDVFPTSLAQYTHSVRFGFGQTVLVLTQGAIASADLQVLAILSAARARLGLYAFASMLAVAIRTAATAGAIVSQTAFLASHRAHASEPDAARDEIEELRRIDTTLAMLFSLGALCVVTALAPTMFPRFRGVVEPLAGMTIAIATLRWGFFHAVALSSRRHQWRTVPFAVLGVATTATWTWVAVRLEWGLVPLSLAPAIGAAVYSIATVVLHDRMQLGHAQATAGAWISIRHMLLFLVAELPLLGLRNEHMWYTNTLITGGSLLLLILMLLLFDRNTSRSLGTLLGSMLGNGRIGQAVLRRSRAIAGVADR